MGAPSKHKIHTETYQTESRNYKKYLDILGFKSQTAQARYLYLREFFSWLEKQKIFEILKITPKEIAGYNHYLQNKISQITSKPITQKSIYEHMRNLQQYLGYLLESGTIKTNPASHLKFNYPDQEVKRIIFTQQQIRELYKATQDLQQNAILNIAYGCGLRVQEISDLNKEDIRLSENFVIVQKGKNDKRRIIPINQKISEELQKYLESAQNNTNALFINSKGRRMQEWGFNARLKQLILKTDFGKLLPAHSLRKIGIHTLRHSIATHLLENGMKLEQVQLFLGHSFIESTEIYTHISQNQINDMMK